MLIKELLENKEKLETLLSRKIRKNFIQELLYQACCTGNADVVRILANKADLEGSSRHFWKPIHFAARFGHLEIVQILLDNKVDSFAMTRYTQIPLHLAIKYGHFEIVKILFNPSCSLLLSFLVYSIKYNQIIIFKYLVLQSLENHFKRENLQVPLLLRKFLTAHENDFSLLEELKKDSNLYEVITKISYKMLSNFYIIRQIESFFRYGCPEIIRILLFLSKEYFKEQDEQISFSLKYIFKSDNVDTFQLIMENEILDFLSFERNEQEPGTLSFAFKNSSYRIIRYYLNRLDSKVKSKFNIAKYYNSIPKSQIEKFTRLFIELNLELELMDESGKRLIHYVCEFGDMDAFRLLANKVNLKVTNNTGMGTLHYACMSGNLELVQELISRKLDINLEDSNRHIPFYFACQKGFEDIVSLLLKNGSLIKTPKYTTPLIVACISDNVKVVKILLDRGEKPEISSNKVTPFHICCSNNNIDIMKVLLLKSNNLDILNHNTMTPLNIAIKNNNLNMVKLAVDGFISERIYQTKPLSNIFSLNIDSILNDEIREYIMSKIDACKRTLFYKGTSFPFDVEIFCKKVDF